MTEPQLDEPRLSAANASDTAAVAKGGAIQIVGQIAARMLVFLFVAVAVRRLGEAGFGLYRQVFQFLRIAGMVAPLGFTFAAVRFIARARALGRHEEVRGVARVTMWGAGVFSTIAALAMVVAAEPLAAAFADDARGQAELAEVVRIGALYVPLFSLMQVLRSATQGYKTVVPSTIVGQIIFPVGRLVLGIAAILAGFAVAGVIWSVVVSAGIALAAAQWYWRRLLTDDERSARPAAAVGPIMRFAIPQAGVALLSVQSLGLSILLLGYFGSDRAVGIFAVALSLQGAGSVFLTGVLAIWAPLVVDLYERREIARLQSLYQTITRWTVTFAFPVYAVLIIAPEAPVRLLTGVVDPDTVTITAVLAVGNLFFVGSGPCSYLISMTGRAGINLANSVAAVALYLVLGIWAVPRYGAVGMAIVDAGVTIVVNSVRVVQGKVLIGVQPFGRSFLKPLAAVAAMALVLLAWGALAPGGFVVEVAGLAVAGAVYLGVLWVLGIDPEERYVFDRIRRRLPWRRR